LKLVHKIVKIHWTQWERCSQVNLTSKLLN